MYRMLGQDLGILTPSTTSASPSHISIAPCRWWTDLHCRPPNPPIQLISVHIATFLQATNSNPPRQAKRKLASGWRTVSEGRSRAWTVEGRQCGISRVVSSLVLPTSPPFQHPRVVSRLIDWRIESISHYIASVLWNHSSASRLASHPFCFLFYTTPLAPVPHLVST